MRVERRDALPAARSRHLLLLLLLIPAILSTAEATNVDRLSVHRDLAWADHERARLDIYVPDGAASAPVLVFIHGGGLLFGDKSLAGHVGLRLAREGLITVAINHRLSPAVTHPAHVEDAAAAVAWVVRHIEDYGGDARRIVLAGHSSGGYLAASLASDPRWLAAAGVDRARIRGLAPISGFFFVDRLAPSRPTHVWGTDPQAWVDASPGHRADAATPPTLLIHADGDAADRRQEGPDFAAVLRARGQADVVTLEVPNRDHRSIFFTIGSVDDAATDALIDFVARVTGT